MGSLRACFSLGDTLATIVRPPLKSPEPPIPATARPIMNAADVGATAHKREPTSKMAMNARKVNLDSGQQTSRLEEDTDAHL